MSVYAALKSVIEEGKPVILDGAIGTELQGMGVPLHNTAWCALSLKDYPSTTQRLHELYIQAGADVITTNTYASARHNLEPLGLGDLTAELNLRAAMLARSARNHAANGRKVWIAGSISAFGILVEREPGDTPAYNDTRPRPVMTAEYTQKCLNEQAEILAAAGVDFFLAECLGGNTHRRWVSDACRRTGLPFWMGFNVRMDEGKICVGFVSKKTFEQALDEMLADDIAGVNLMHSNINTIDSALAILKRKWKGPIGIYPEADRSDTLTVRRDESEKNAVDEEEFARHARRWLNAGAQLIGGCCGIGVSYIKRLAIELAPNTL